MLTILHSCEAVARAHLATQVYFNEATGGRYVPRAVLMDLEPGPCVHPRIMIPYPMLPCASTASVVQISYYRGRNNHTYTIWGAL